jgi:hypothetical protein
MDASMGPCYVFVALCVLNGVRWLLLRSKIGFVHQHKMRLAQEIASLRKEAAVFNTPSTYVKCAKFQRLANAKEKELAALQEHKDSSLQDKIDAVVTTAKVRTTAAGTAATASGPSHILWYSLADSTAAVCILQRFSMEDQQYGTPACRQQLDCAASTTAATVMSAAPACCRACWVVHAHGCMQLQALQHGFAFISAFLLLICTSSRSCSICSYAPQQQ